MFFQRILKGVADIDEKEATRTLTETGILSRWLANYGLQHGVDIQRRLTRRNLDWHLNHYDEPDPLMSHRPFYEHTPFISATAGTVERDVAARQNYVHSAFRTALAFATRDYTTHGWIFFGYVYALGKRATALEAFAEEVRDLHVYTGFLPYQHEGEITAKLRIPAACLERCERYVGPDALDALARGRRPTPDRTIDNPDFAAPEAYTNLRETLD